MILAPTPLQVDSYTESPSQPPQRPLWPHQQAALDGCLQCGAPTGTKPGAYHRPPKFCSCACNLRYQAIRRKLGLQARFLSKHLQQVALEACLQCGGKTGTKPGAYHRPPKFCSPACNLRYQVIQRKLGLQAEHQGSPRPHLTALNRSPGRNAAISLATKDQRADAQRGRGEGKTYRKRGGKHEHRGVMEKILGRNLGRNEIVHHIDHNKFNNTPENLQLMTRAEHARHHFHTHKNK